MSEENEVVEENTEVVEDNSLLDGSSELGEGEYYLTDGIKGAGDIPDWYKGDKYKTVASQAEAYTALEKKFGGFSGAPKDGYYLPEGVEESALSEAFVEMASDSGMSQETFDKGFELLQANSEAGIEANKEIQIGLLGENAAQRIKTVEGFLRNNLGADEYKELAGGVESAQTIMLIEQLIKSTGQTTLPSDGGINPTGVTKEQIKAVQFQKDEHGNLLMSVSADHRAKFKGMMESYYGTGDHVKVVG